MRFSKNFRPLRSGGRWLAVIITAPSQSVSGNTQLMNMAGVEAMPQSSTVKPIWLSVLHTAACSAGPVKRESRPTATRQRVGAFPQASDSQKPKP